MKKSVLSILIAGFWITISEFFRNELLLKAFWANHYIKLHLSFTTLPLNGLLWTLWSFILALLIYKLIKKYSFIETFLITWSTAFVMMWIVIFNLQVLPINILIYAAPLSLIEIIIAEFIIKSVTKADKHS